ncbi:MAG: hypothetical protein FWD31_05365 [Planctomycetaceae bacterium]|nr:hypothetical protein [Planctomycetaceae bacterium]
MTELELKPHLICYIDILGYEEKMKELGENEFLEILTNVYQKAIDIITVSIPELQQYEYRIFSDNLVFCTKKPENGDELTNMLFLFIFVAYVLQTTFIKHEIFIRGSITEGQFYVDTNYVYGKGLIDAYKLENEVALYPRIVLDQKLNIHGVKQKYSSSIFHLCDDGYDMINYLLDMRKTEIEPLRTILEPYLIHKLHKTFVEKALRKHKSNERIYQKYRWCREYHNRVCSNPELPELLEFIIDEN